MRIVIASHNLHKIRELRDILRSLKNLDILSLRDFPDYSLPPETGETFEENAIIKAKHAAKALGEWVLADDSGLAVPALAGAPGVYSRRYAGEEATDGENRKKLLKQMAKLEERDRSAYYECFLALAAPNEPIKGVRGTCAGAILCEERGGNGFGYDPLFLKNDYDKTFAEMDEMTKNRISHRYKAIEKLLPFLESLK